MTEGVDVAADITRSQANVTCDRTCELANVKLFIKEQDSGKCSAQ